MSRYISRLLRRLYDIYIYILYNRYGDVTIISNNCIAGFIYHDIKGVFCSPTINLQIPPIDFVKFVNNIDYYLVQELVEIHNPPVEGFRKLGGEEINFPVGQLGDITIYFQHYTNFIEAKRKWEQRKERIVKDNIILVLVDTFCTQDIIEEYSKAPYRKLFLSNDAGKKEWIKDGEFLQYDSAECTQWHEFAKKDSTFDLFGRRYFEKTDIFRHIFK